MNSKTTERRFDIMFDGSTLNGANISEVKNNLQQLFKLGDADIERMFSGQPISIKKDLDRKTATQYQQALSRAGAKIQLVLHQPDAEPSTAAGTLASTPAPATGTDFGVLPAGSDLLSAGERTSAAPRDVNTDHLQLEAPGAGSGGRAVFDVGEAPAASAEATADSARYPSADHIELDTALSVAEVGAILDQQEASPAAVDVSVDHLQLLDPAEAGTPAADTAQEKVVLAETDFSIADAGSDLLQAHEKRQPVEANIDLSKISLSQD
ncbi:MAG: hypothetical protein HKO71_01470 [Pseudomonadales bacterium]|nr:hypothetical protein [Gammaproteobacteria bacterium]NNL56396.1 hypothetical protein [Pseudomonadales bacterium]